MSAKPKPTEHLPRVSMLESYAVRAQTALDNGHDESAWELLEALSLEAEAKLRLVRQRVRDRRVV